jgi:predicted Zn-dependent protease
LKGFFQIHLGSIEPAKTEFAQVRKIDPGYRWLKVYEAALFLAEGDPQKALESAQDALKQCPGTELVFRSWKVFSPILPELLKPK